MADGGDAPAQQAYSEDVASAEDSDPLHQAGHPNCPIHEIAGHTCLSTTSKSVLTRLADSSSRYVHRRAAMPTSIDQSPMKPKVFIGSSVEGKAVADAIDTRLQYTAEPKVWTNGVFNLSETSVASLMREVSESDFGIFVFTPDDATNIRGRLLTVPRDNVIYELGLFSGALGPERCFFVTPLHTDIHLPSDLLGMTAGHYDPNRRDRNLEAAVNPICTRIEQKFKELSFRHGAAHDRLLELAVDYERCGRIPQQEERIRERNKIFGDMQAFVRAYPVNKLTLLNKHRLGFYMTVAAAIVARPEAGDYDLLLSANRGELHPGQAQLKILDAMIALKEAGKLTPEEKRRLEEWSSGFSKPEEWTLKRLAEFKR